MAELKLVIFDCDGVLVDTEVIAKQVISESLKTFGLDMSVDQCMEAFVGFTTENVKREIKKLGVDLPDNWAATIDAEDETRAILGVDLISGVVSTLNALEAAKIPYCVASNGKILKMNITLGQHGLLNRFEGAMFSAVELGTAKPEPKLFLHTAETLGVLPENCVVIEDSPAGAMAAKRAGMKCFGFAPRGGGEKLAANDAVVFDAMVKLPALLGL